jgi:hypothetical protein
MAEKEAGAVLGCAVEKDPAGVFLLLLLLLLGALDAEKELARLGRGLNSAKLL